MKSMKKCVPPFLAVPLCSFCLISASCGGKTVVPPPAKPPALPSALPSAENPAPKAEPAPPDTSDPSNFSYPVILGEASLSELSALPLAEPFPRSVSSGENGFEAASFKIGEDGMLRYDTASWGVAKRGAHRYRIIEGNLVVAETEEASVVREAWRYRSASVLTAGPIACDDLVLAATDKPSFVAVDRKTGALAYERPIRVLVRGPLFLLSGASRLAALGADGSVVLYDTAVKAETPLDPVEEFLRPSDEAFALMEKRLRDRLGKRDEKPSVSFMPSGARGAIPAEGVVLFRADFPTDQRSRVYVEGAASRPFLVEIYAASGEVLSSNLDYTGVESVLEYSFAAGKTYFIAAALLAQDDSDASDGKPSAAISRPRLVIAPK